MLTRWRRLPSSLHSSLPTKLRLKQLGMLLGMEERAWIEEGRCRRDFWSLLGAKRKRGVLRFKGWAGFPWRDGATCLGTAPWNGALGEVPAIEDWWGEKERYLCKVLLWISSSLQESPSLFSSRTKLTCPIVNPQIYLGRRQDDRNGLWPSQVPEVLLGQKTP